MPRYRQFPKSDDTDLRKKTSRPLPTVSASMIGTALALVPLIAFVLWLPLAAPPN